MRISLPAHRARLVGVAVIAVLLLSVARPTAVGAADEGGVTGLVDRLSQSADPAAAYAALPLSDRAALREFLTAVSVTDESAISVDSTLGTELSPVTTTCWTWTWRRDGRNVFGAILWSYFQRIDWCGNGSTITSSPHGVQRTRWGEVYYPFWQWRHVGNQTWGGVGQPSYRAWTQAEFKLCFVPDVGCVQYSYPWLDMTAWADGRGTGSAGG